MLDRAQRWLHRERGSLDHWRGDEDALAESLEGAFAGLDALVAAGVLSPESAAAWRAIYRSGEQRVAAGPEVRERSERFLAGLREAVPADPEWDDPDAQRYEAAVELLSAIGAVDRRAWPTEEDAEVEPAAYPASRAGGTESELVGVLPGPPGLRRGYRLLLVLRFADGVSFWLDKHPARALDDEWPEWRLTDDLGTVYWGDGGGGGHEEERISFGTPIPARATWIELALEGRHAVSFRVRLD